MEVGRQLAKELRSKHECRVVVALTHMRWPNTTKVATECPEVDLVLAGHDHFYRAEFIGTTFVVNSGCDFKQFTELHVQVPAAPGEPLVVDFEEHSVTSAYAEHGPLLGHIANIRGMVLSSMSRVVGHLDNVLDATSADVRLRESNVGNLVSQRRG